MTAMVERPGQPRGLLQRFRHLGFFQEAAPIVRVFVRNRPAVIGGLLLFGFGIVAAFAPLIAPADPLTTNLRLESVFQPPSWDHIFGTDAQGRDVLSRTLYGARIAWQIVLAAIGVAIVLGVPLGLISGYIGGKLDELIIMRIVDALMAMPGLILILAVTGALGPSITNSMIVIGIVWSPGYARLTRGIIVSIRNDVYVDAAPGAGRDPLANHVASPFAQCGRPDHGPRLTLRCRHHPRRGRIEFHRRRRPATDPRLGRNGLRGLQNPDS